MSSLFISYRRADSPGTVKNLFDRLKTRLPRWMLFYDHKNLTPGEDFPERLRQEVTSAKVVLVAIGPRWVESLKERRNRPEIDHVREEVRLALDAGNKVIPVLVENASMPKDADLIDFPELLPLLRHNGRLVRPDPDFDNDIERLAAFLDELGPGVGAGTVLAGKYKILREIGQGGMGVVYQAEQLQPRRAVAVKMILEGMDTKEVLARFDSEKEALARMDHPNIARVIDSGSSPSGKPYFVMEFVKGEPITAYCDRKRLLPNDRLGLLRQVCSAVQHAHQKGIIHRDIKPSNVLIEEVDGQPIPKVIDFGLAKALAGKLTDKTLVSEVGKTVGTLIYSSPEQAAGRQYDVDTRTDVYSLGVLMYELLAGAPPFTEDELKKIGDDAMRKEIIGTEPSKPSTKLSSSNALLSIAANRQLEPAKLTRLVRGELDWIAMRALEKEPQRRYETPIQLSDDIERYLHNEPVKAGKPNALYRLKKFVRRNRGPVLAGCLLVIALAAGLIAVNMEQRKTDVALTQRKTALDDAESERNKAIESAALASKRFDEKRLALDEMLKTFSDKNLRGQPGSQPIRKLFLERGIEQYQAMLADRAGDPDVSLHTGNALRELGIVTNELGNTEESLAQFARAVDICRASAAANPNDLRLVAALGDALFEQAQALFVQQRNTDAKPFADESVEIFKSLSEKSPTEIDYQAKWGRALVRRASLLPKEQSPDVDQTQGLKLLRAVVEAKPNNPDYLIFLARAVNNDASSRFGTKPQALGAYKEAVTLTERAIQLAPAVHLGNALRAVFVRNASKTLIEANKSSEAIAYVDGMLAAIRRNVVENPAVIDGPVFLADLLGERARVLEILARPDDAIRTYQEIVQVNDALAQRDPSNDKYPLNSIEASGRIARIHEAQHRGADAIQVLDAVVSRSSEIMSLRPTSESLLGALLRLHEKQGGLLSEAKRHEQARKTYEGALDLYDRHRDLVKHKSEYLTYIYISCCDNLAFVARKLNSTAMAMALLERRVRPINPESLKTLAYQEVLLTSLDRLSSMYAESNQLEKALKLRLEIVDVAAKGLKGDPSSNWYLYEIVFKSHKLVADLNRKLGNDRGSFEALRKYFAETEPYVHEKDHSALLAERADFTPDNLRKLWEVFDNLSGRDSWKRFTIPVDFNGVKEPIHIYIADSWKFLEDQIKWVETVRGGRFPKEVTQSFRTLYDIAKKEKVSFQDVCVFALGEVRNNSESIKGFEKLVKQRALVLANPRDTGLRLQLAEDTLALAAFMEKGEDPTRALLFLDDVGGDVARCIADGAKDDDRIARVQAGMDFVRGKVFLKQHRVDAAYAEFLSVLRASKGTDVSAALQLKDLFVELGNASQKRKHSFEAATWYFKAAEAGASLGLQELMVLIRKDISILSVLPGPLQELLAKKPLDANERPDQRLARLWPQYSPAIDRTKKIEEIARLRQAAESSKEPRSSLEKAFNFKDDYAVLLLRGRNGHGDQIYCYLKVNSQQLKALQQVLKGSAEFNISDYGTVIYAAKGKPSTRVKAEILRAYPANMPRTTIHQGNSTVILGPWEALMESDPIELPRLLADRAAEFVAKGQTDEGARLEVARCAAKLREIGAKNKSTLYEAACAYSLCAGLVAQGKLDPTQAKIAEKKRYQDLAIACLKEAITAGYSDFEQIDDDDDLTPLRDLPSFKALHPSIGLKLGPWEKLINSDPKKLPRLLSDRAVEFAKKGQIDEVARCAAKLREIGGKNKSTIYEAACAYSLCAGLVAQGKLDPTQAKIAEKKRYQDLAITCLKEAIAAGFSDFKHIAQDEDFAPLRDLPEFKALFPKSK
jgi:serine/threonine protein kinase